MTGCTATVHDEGNRSVPCPREATMAVRTTAPRDKCLTTQFWQDEADAPKTASRYCVVHGVEIVRDLAKLADPDTYRSTVETERFYDVVMTVAPHADGEFVELEDQDGRGVGSSSGTRWLKPGVDSPDRFWRLRIPR